MWFMTKKYQVLFVVVMTSTYDLVICDAISNTKFNSNIRDYTTADIINTTNLKTLHKEELDKYATFSPTKNPIKFKEIPDSALSSSINGRGFLYHEQPGYALSDYEEGFHYSHGNDYHSYNGHPDSQSPHGYEQDHHLQHQHDHHDHHDHNEHHFPQNHHDNHEHYSPHDHDYHHYSGHHNLDHGHHYNKHFKHALAAKSLLWPIAGIALLGAAALVTNPVVLQLGVISGKRRRRDTEEITGPDFTSDTLTKYEEQIEKQNKDYSNTKKYPQNNNLRKSTKPAYIEKSVSRNENFQRRILKTNIVKDSERNLGIRKIQSSVKKHVDQVITYPARYNNDNDDDKFIPIAVKLWTPYSNVNN